MHILKLGVCFDLHHNIFDEKVDSLLTHNHAMIVDVDPDFPAKLQSFRLQFERQSALVNYLFKSWTQIAMNPGSRADDSSSNL
jgi:hypothetical protein